MDTRPFSYRWIGPLETRRNRPYLLLRAVQDKPTREKWTTWGNRGEQFMVATASHH